MQISFKVAEIHDTPALLDLRAEFNRFEPFPKILDEKTNQAALSELISNQQFGKIWLISFDDEIIGYVILTFGFSLEYAGRDALIDELFLRGKWRGRGFGREVLNFVENYCRELDVKAIHLEVEHKNERALALYQKTGFINHDRYFLTKWI